MPTIPPQVQGDPILVKYLTNFETFADKHQADGTAYLADDYYDRTFIYYQAADMPEFAARRLEYIGRAEGLAIDYRTNYLEKNKYGASPHWSLLEGLVEHYRRTGDEKSKTAVIETAKVLNRAEPVTGGYFKPTGGGESRIHARVTLANLLAWGLSQDPQFSKPLDQVIPILQAWQKPDGSWPASVVCGGQLNYMVGMLCTVLAQYYDEYRQDMAVLDLIIRSLDYIVNTQVKSGSVQYASVDCSSKNVGGMGLAPDLNMFYPWPLEWAAQHVPGRATQYRTAARQLFDVGVQKAYITGEKQFNENYHDSLRYYKALLAALAPPAPVVPDFAAAPIRELLDFLGFTEKDDAVDVRAALSELYRTRQATQ